MVCNKSKISIDENIQTEICKGSDVNEIPISNEIKKLNIKVNIIRPNPMIEFEDTKRLRIKNPYKKISF